MIFYRDIKWTSAAKRIEEIVKKNFQIVCLGAKIHTISMPVIMSHIIGKYLLFFIIITIIHLKFLAIFYPWNLDHTLWSSWAMWTYTKNTY